MLKRFCKVPECGEPHHANGYCTAHDHRMRRYGSPYGKGKGKQKTSLLARFKRKVLPPDNHGCVINTAQPAHERGMMRIESGETKLMTHVSWFLRHGYWPKQLNHKCKDKPRCVNPDHLYEGDDYANMQDRKKDIPGYVRRRVPNWLKNYCVDLSRRGWSDRRIVDMLARSGWQVYQKTVYRWRTN